MESVEVVLFSGENKMLSAILWNSKLLPILIRQNLQYVGLPWGEALTPPWIPAGANAGPGMAGIKKILIQ
jgi:hypothetical protein